MPRVSLVIPVFNGASTLRASLESAVAQTFTDMEIVVLDNASADDTPAIIQEFAYQDRRIVNVRQTKNIGAKANFADGLRRARGELLAFRAHDDVSSSDYIERLVAAFDARPDAVLAVGTVKRVFPDGRESLIRPAKDDSLTTRLIGSASSWYYGLWRRDYLATRFHRISAAFPHLWAYDHLTMYEALVGGKVAIDPEAVFTQIVPARASYAAPAEMPLAELRQIRAAFLRQCRADNARLPPLLRLRAALLLQRYADRKVWPRRRIWRRFIREMFVPLPSARAV